MKGLMMGALCAIVSVCLSVSSIGVSAARAGSLNLVPQNPDLAALNLTVDYQPTSGSTGTLTATGWPTSFTITGTNTPDYPSIDNGTYDLTAQVTKTGQPISGTLDIGGTIPGLASSGTLLTGQLSQFGFQNSGGDIFEFVFNVTGGDLAPYYHGQTGVILDATGSGFNGSFANTFSTQADEAVADNFTVVPEPSTTVLLLCVSIFGLPIVSCSRLRRARMSK
jgi:hypothetical protein